MKRMEHQDRANCRPLYDAGRTQQHDDADNCNQPFQAPFEVYVTHRGEHFAAECGAEHGQGDDRKDQPPAWQSRQPSRLNDRNAPKGDFDQMGDRLRNGLCCDDLVTGQRRVDEEQINQRPSNAGRGVQRLNDETRDFGLPLFGNVEIEQCFGNPHQHRGDAQHEVNALGIGTPCQRKQDGDADSRADRVAPNDGPQNMIAPEKSAITVRDHLDGAVQDHRGGNWQEGRQDAHQYHAACHAENAGQESRYQDGDEYDRDGQYVHAARFMAQFVVARQIRRCDSTDFAADLSAIPQMICTPSPVWLS